MTLPQFHTLSQREDRIYAIARITFPGWLTTHSHEAIQWNKVVLDRSISYEGISLAISGEILQLPTPKPFILTCHIIDTRTIVNVYTILRQFSQGRGHYP